MERKVEVVVLLATYNGDKYLREQIESILIQKNVAVKIIVSDDGSTDNTINILEEYRCKGYLKWYSGPQKGVERNFMNLMQIAPTADYYAFCDQDDVWDKEKLFVAVSRLKQMEDSKPCLYYSSLKLVDQDLKYISTHNVNRDRSDFAKFIYSGVAGCTMVYNKVLLEACRSKQPDYIRMHDIWVFDICLALGGTYYADEDSYINYRQHSNNTVGIKKNSIIEIYKMYVEDSKVARHMNSLLNCYSDEMIPEYQNLCDLLVNSYSNIVCRKKLLMYRGIKFCNTGLSMIFKMKILMKKI